MSRLLYSLWLCFPLCFLLGVVLHYHSTPSQVSPLVNRVSLFRCPCETGVRGFKILVSRQNREVSQRVWRKVSKKCLKRGTIVRVVTLGTCRRWKRSPSTVYDKRRWLPTGVGTEELGTRLKGKKRQNRTKDSRKSTHCHWIKVWSEIYSRPLFKNNQFRVTLVIREDSIELIKRIIPLCSKPVPRLMFKST